MSIKKSNIIKGLANVIKECEDNINTIIKIQSKYRKELNDIIKDDPDNYRVNFLSNDIEECSAMIVIWNKVIDYLYHFDEEVDDE